VWQAWKVSEEGERRDDPCDEDKVPGPASSGHVRPALFILLVDHGQLTS
jgi:hypothetical protein